jgi:hypothetical protein
MNKKEDLNWGMKHENKKILLQLITVLSADGWCGCKTRPEWSKVEGEDYFCTDCVAQEMIKELEECINE